VCSSDLEAETLTIGAIFQLTDWYSAIDGLELVDAQAVVKMINDEGGVTVQGKRYNIELLIEDGKSTLDGNTAAAKKLVMDHKAKLVVGPSGFFNVATTPIFEAAKVLHVCNYNTCQPGEMGPDTPYAFLGNDPVVMYNGAVKALLQQYPDVKTLAMAVGEDAGTPYVQPHLESMITRMGLQLVDEPLKFSPALDDFNPIAAKLHAYGDEVDAYMFSMGTPPNFAAIAKGLRSLGDEKPIAHPGYAPSTISMVGADAATHIVNSGSYGYKAPGNPEVLDKIFELGGDTERQFLGLAPNSVYMLVEAIKSADSLDPDAIRTAWEGLDSIATIYGEGFPSGEELYGLKHHAWVYPTAVTHIMDGSFEYVGWVSPDPTP
jgi:branched-chain amino acid transport system substrate-binding protein